VVVKGETGGESGRVITGGTNGAMSKISGGGRGRGEGFWGGTGGG